MNPYLKEMCLEILSSDIDGERFSKLLLETGISIESFEWDLISKMLNQETAAACEFVRLGKAVH